MRLSFAFLFLVFAFEPISTLSGFTLLRAQNTDSLEQVLEEGKLSPEEKLDAYYTLSRAYDQDNKTNAVKYAEKYLELATELNRPELQIKGYLRVGTLRRNRGRVEDAHVSLVKALKIADSLQNKELQAEALHKIGVTYLLSDEFKRSYNYAVKEEKLRRQIGDSIEIARAVNFKGLSMSNLDNWDDAIRELEYALGIARRHDDPKLQFKTLVNIGGAYTKAGNASKALGFIEESYQISKGINDLFGMSISSLKKGQTLTELNRYEDAIDALNEGLELAKQLQSPSMVRNAYLYLSDTYEAQQDYKSALYFRNFYHATKDSVFNQESRNHVAEIQALYSLEKQRRKIEDLQREKKLRNTIVAAVFLAGALVILFIFIRIRDKQKTNNVLQARNEEISEINNKLVTQAGVIETANAKLTESITYAKKIQDAVQINETDFHTTFPDTFLLNKPRDIVSGDCYWYGQQDGCYYFALADCTGHGVPGAFMTILCNTLLNSIFSEINNPSPSFMLETLDKRLIHTLHQQRSKIRDGMDIALCMFNPKEDSLTYAGAKMPLIYIDENGELNRIKGDKFPIGGHKFDKFSGFTEYKISYKKGYCFYLTSDGFQDQFGGGNDRKFLSKRFRKTLSGIHNAPMEEQMHELERTFNEWKGAKKQTDDIMVFGLRV